MNSNAPATRPDAGADQYLESKKETASIKTGGNLAAFVPQDFEQAYRLATALANGGGDMIPRHFQGNPGATFAAMAKGAELGMTPLAALSTIAVVNGRASLWGDALPALVLKAGHMLDEEVVGEGDDMVATAIVTRGDTGQKIKRTFSMKDAERAGLAKKQGPWQQYTKRMLQMRARGFAVRDGCADAMLGLSVAEEMRDVADSRGMRNVTPEASEGNAILASLPDAEPEPEPQGQEDSAPAETATQSEVIDPPADETPETTGDPERNTPDPEQFEKLAGMIEKELNAIIDPADIDSILEVYAPRLAEMKSVIPDRAKEIDDAIKARREALAA